MLQRSAGPHTVIGFARIERLPDRVQTWNKCTVGAERLEHFCAYPCHNVHIADNVLGVGNFDTDFCNVGTYGTHRKGDNIQSTSLHATIVQRAHRFFELNRVSPVVCRAGIFFFF